MSCLLIKKLATYKVKVNYKEIRQIITDLIIQIGNPLYNIQKEMISLDNMISKQEKVNRYLLQEIKSYEKLVYSMKELIIQYKPDDFELRSH